MQEAKDFGGNQPLMIQFDNPHHFDRYNDDLFKGEKQ
jgi:hypothetical protein